MNNHDALALRYRLYCWFGELRSHDFRTARLHLLLDI